MLKRDDRPVVYALLAVAFALFVNVSLSPLATSHSDQQQSENKTSDGAQERVPPIETETFWVFMGFLATCVIAVYGIRQFEEGRRSAEHQLRAYVHPVGINPGISIQSSPAGSYVDGYLLLVPWKNFGQTPAKNVRIEVGVCSFPANENREPQFSQQRVRYPSGVDVGPGGEGTGQNYIQIADLTRLWHRELEIFVLVRLEYFDVFRPEERKQSGICARLDLIHDPTGIPPRTTRPISLLRYMDL